MMLPSSMYHQSARPLFFFLKSMTLSVSTEFFGSTQLKIGDSLHLGCVFCLQALHFRRFVNTSPRKAA